MVLECYEQEALARSASALQLRLSPFETTRCDLPEANGSSQFELRALESDLPKHLRPSGPKPNPFLPWDPRLEVAQVGSDHALILNKYPVQLGHMLLVTRQWAAQGTGFNLKTYKHWPQSISEPADFGFSTVVRMLGRANLIATSNCFRAGTLHRSVRANHGFWNAWPPCKAPNATTLALRKRSVFMNVTSKSRIRRDI